MQKPMAQGLCRPCTKVNYLRMAGRYLSRDQRQDKGTQECKPTGLGGRTESLTSQAAYRNKIRSKAWSRSNALPAGKQGQPVGKHRSTRWGDSTEGPVGVPGASALTCWAGAWPGGGRQTSTQAAIRGPKYGRHSSPGGARASWISTGGATELTSSAQATVRLVGRGWKECRLSAEYIVCQANARIAHRPTRHRQAAQAPLSVGQRSLGSVQISRFAIGATVPRQRCPGSIRSDGW